MVRKYRNLPALFVSAVLESPISYFSFLFKPQLPAMLHWKLSCRPVANKKKTASAAAFRTLFTREAMTEVHENFFSSLSKLATLKEDQKESTSANERLRHAVWRDARAPAPGPAERAWPSLVFYSTGEKSTFVLSYDHVFYLSTYTLKFDAKNYLWTIIIGNGDICANVFVNLLSKIFYSTIFFLIQFNLYV